MERLPQGGIEAASQDPLSSRVQRLPCRCRRAAPPDALREHMPLGCAELQNREQSNDYYGLRALSLEGIRLAVISDQNRPHSSFLSYNKWVQSNSYGKANV